MMSSITPEEAEAEWLKIRKDFPMSEGLFAIVIRAHDLGILQMGKVFCNSCGQHMNFTERMLGGYRFQDNEHDIVIGGE